VWTKGPKNLQYPLPKERFDKRKLFPEMFAEAAAPTTVWPAAFEQIFPQ
jgi:hypothetical protein